MSDKILVANRGEVACRIIRAARRMGLKTVAVYSDADIDSLHVNMAHEAIPLGGSLSSESYLDQKKIIDACKKVGANYLHPGWGFLSENAKFAQLVEKEGIVFVGPSYKSMKLMGDKISSKKIAKKANVSIAPGDNIALITVDDVKAEAKKIGYPVMLKASAGGGGKGIRVVYKEEDIPTLFESVQNEVRGSYSDDRIFMEKYITRPRHIEIQIIGDKHGNVVCLGERECSIQRKHQKIIEESPSPFVDNETRQKMYKEAISLAKSAGYYSAGTLEFMMDEHKNYYFLEMNTRLQVEHGVTELVTGFDLVELMIRVARGEKLPFTQDDVKINGWALECRINAEDPTRGFLPSIGRINKYIEPKKSNDVRIDTGVYAGCNISMFYDSMIAKILTHGENRNDVIQKMMSALGEFYIDGIMHNMSFLEAILRNEKFQKGDMNTDFIQEEFSHGFSNYPIENKDENIPIGAALYMFVMDANRLLNISGQVLNFKRELPDKWIVNLNGIQHLCKIKDKNKGLLVEYENGFISIESSWQFGDNVFRGEINEQSVHLKLLSNNKAGTMKIQFMGSINNITIRTPRVAELEKYMPKVQHDKKPTKIKSPITGKIVRFPVKEGDEIKAGDELVIIEAMKMENIIRSDWDAKIKKIYFTVGSLIGVGEVIMEFE